MRIDTCANSRAARIARSADQHREHLEALIQIQLETIALRGGHYANACEQAERAVEYAQSLEAERERLEAELVRSRKSLRRLPGRLGR